MRKAIWCCVALVTLATLGVYGAARYAVSHPDSFLARVTWVVSPVRFQTKMDHACAVPGRVDQAVPEDAAPEVESPRQPREIFEPIVVVPGDQPEPPIGLPPLPIQPGFIIEESEVPLMPFVEDQPDLYMPYADE